MGVREHAVRLSRPEGPPALSPAGEERQVTPFLSDLEKQDLPPRILTRLVLTLGGRGTQTSTCPISTPDPKSALRFGAGFALLCGTRDLTLQFQAVCGLPRPLQQPDALPPGGQLIPHLEPRSLGRPVHEKFRSQTVPQ